MDRVVRLYQLWSWLPHFRAVAETEHLPTASEAFGVSSSALSRALKQLEESVGRDLFVRDRGAIRLNENGEILLSAVRYAMRSIDDAVVALTAGDVPLTIRVAAPGPYHPILVLPAIAAAKQAHSTLSFVLLSCPSDDVVNSLCRGRIDVVVHEGVIEHPELESTALGTIEKMVFAAKQHPLLNREQGAVSSLTVADLARFPFAGPPPSSAGFCLDGWPAGRKRKLGLVVSHMQMGIDACQSGDYLTVLPRKVGISRGLIPLAIDGLTIGTGTVHATRRRVIEMAPQELGEFVELLKRALTDSSLR